MIYAQFETDFAQYERNRMYPPGYGKDTAMIKMTLDHVSAISHAETYIHPAIVSNMSPHHRNAIEDDLTRLAEVKRFILKAIYEPGLPMSPDTNKESPNHGDANQRH